MVNASMLLLEAPLQSLKLHECLAAIFKGLFCSQFEEAVKEDFELTPGPSIENSAAEYGN